jgi:hypothetical protein
LTPEMIDQICAGCARARLPSPRRASWVCQMAPCGRIWFAALASGPHRSARREVG